MGTDSTRRRVLCRRTTIAALLLATLLVASCVRRPRIAVRELPNPAAPGSISPNQTATPDGGILLSWLEPANEGLALRFAVRRGPNWSAPQTIVARKNFDKYAEAPPWVVMLANRSLVAVWAEQLPPGKGKWPGNYLLAAASSDGGRNWSRPSVIHSDRTDGEHSFASVAVEDDSHAAIVWLDSRDNEKKHVYRLMSAVIDSAGTVSGEKTVDADVCTCCPTALIKTSQGLLAAYRNHTSQEIRDIYTIREQAGNWQTGKPLHDDGWHINGCPVNGPALARHDNRVVAAWFTGLERQAAVRVAFSSDGGASFGAASTLDSADGQGAPLGKVAVALLESGDAWAAWIRRQNGHSQMVVAQVRPNQGEIFRHIVAEDSSDRLGYPRMQLMNVNALISWGGAGAESKVNTTLISNH